MIRCLSTIVILLYCKLAFAQLTVGGFQSDCICGGVNNVIEISSLDNCNDLKAVVSGYSDTFSIDSCRFKLYPLTKDTTYVSLYKRGVLQYKDTLYASEIQAKSFVLIDDVLYSEGTIPYEKLKNLKGIRLKYECPWVHQKIIGFSLAVVGESQNYILIRNQGENLTAASRAELLSFANPKTIFIEEILVVPITHQKPPNSIVIKIK